MFGKSCLIIGGSVLIRRVDFRMFGKSCLIIGGSVLIRGVDFGCLVRVAPKVYLSYQDRSPIIRQLLPNILKSTSLIRTDPRIIRQLLPNILKSTSLIRTDPIEGSVLIREVDFMMFGKSYLIIEGSVLIREVDFMMFGKSCLIIGGSVLIRGVD
jgi:hypothetical protein